MDPPAHTTPPKARQGLLCREGTGGPGAAAPPGYSPEAPAREVTPECPWLGVTTCWQKDVVGSLAAGLRAVSAASLPSCRILPFPVALRLHSCASSAPPATLAAGQFPARLPAPLGTMFLLTGQSRSEVHAGGGRWAWASVSPPLTGLERVGLELGA